MEKDVVKSTAIVAPFGQLHPYAETFVSDKNVAARGHNQYVACSIWPKLFEISNTKKKLSRHPLLFLWG